MSRNWLVWAGGFLALSGCSGATVEPEEAGSKTSQQQPAANAPVNDLVAPVNDPVATALRGKPIRMDAVRSLTFAPDGKALLVGYGDGGLVRWDLEARRADTALMGHLHWVFDIEFAPGGDSFATAGGDDAVKLWTWPGMKATRWLKEHKDDAHGVAYAPDEQTLFSGGDDRAVRRWDLKTGRSTLVGSHDRQVTGVETNRTRSQIASSSRDGSVRLWNAETGNLEQTLLVDRPTKGESRGDRVDVLATAFHPQRDLLATASYDQTVRVWDTSTGTLLHTMPMENDWCLSVAWSPDGGMLAAASGDGQVRVWNPDLSRLIARFEAKSEIAEIEFSPQSDQLAVGLATGDVHLLTLDGEAFRLTATFEVKDRGTIDGSNLSGNEWLTLFDEARSQEPRIRETALTRLRGLRDPYLPALWDLLAKSTPDDSDNATATDNKADARTLQLKSVLGERPTDLGQVSAKRVAAMLPAWLERAAAVDLVCHPLEGHLVSWTMSTVRQHATDPLVRRRLGDIAESFEPAAEVEGPAFGVIKERVTQYARRLLAPETPGKE